ncbi:MAG: hypothetical protein A4E52_00478 [Pelotomaculum sp. PtaB.Bin013]|nr:MAG: hypothetical protein A4E52_00478 [Pelotomaculum sp. PtaB.Bin013]
MIQVSRYAIRDGGVLRPLVDVNRLMPISNYPRLLVPDGGILVPDPQRPLTQTITQ